MISVSGRRRSGGSILLPVLSMPAALCLNRDLRIIQMYIISSALPIRGSATYDLREVFFTRLQQNMYMYVSIYVHAHVYMYLCLYMNVCTYIHVINV